MKPFVADPDFTLYVGDVRQVLEQLPDSSIDCVVTSPPYWGLRDYGVDGQIGLEASPDCLGWATGDECGECVPWRVALALQADGWWLRSDVIWSKPNAMPESTGDRPTKSHEYVFLLAKQARYFFDPDAVREPNRSADDPRAIAQARGEYEPKRVPSVRPPTFLTVRTLRPSGFHVAPAWVNLRQPS